MKRLFVLIALLALVTAACASGGDSRRAGLPQETLPAGDDAPNPVEPGDGIGDGSPGSDLPLVSLNLVSEVDQAIADLASRLGDDSSIISVIVAHELTWPDGSLGCPEPGMFYTQALVDGYRIELTDGDTVFQYNGAIGRAPFLCENARGEGPGPGPNLIPPTTTP